MAEAGRLRASAARAPFITPVTQVRIAVILVTTANFVVRDVRTLERRPPADPVPADADLTSA